MKQREVIVTLGACCAWLMVGCMSYTDQAAAIRYDYLQGDYEQALLKAEAKVERQGPKGADALVWQLERNTLLRLTGRFAESEAAFEATRALYAAYLDEAKISLSREGLALLSTPANLPYKGTGYDGIMLDTYQALNAMKLGDMDKARVCLVRSYLLQQEIVDEHARRIVKEQAAVREDENLRQSMATNSLTMDASALEGIQTEMAAYADYVNPFTVYLDGIYHLAQANDASDVERARKSLERVNGFAPENVTVQHDFAIASAAIDKAAFPPTVYVVFETGLAAALESVRVDIPIMASRLSFVGIAFPKLVLNPEYVPCLHVKGATGEGYTTRVASMDAIIAREYANNYASMMTRAIASAVAKAVAAYAVNAAAEDNPWTQLLSQVSTAAYQLATNIADTRSWQTLPKEFQLFYLPMPNDRTVTLSTPDGVWAQDIIVDAGDIVVLYVRSLCDPAKTLVHQFKLK